MKLQPIPRFTLICYLVALLIIGLVFLAQHQAWLWFDRQWQVGLLTLAVIIGVSGSLVSIVQQIRRFLSSKSHRDKP